MMISIQYVSMLHGARTTLRALTYDGKFGKITRNGVFPKYRRT